MLSENNNSKSKHQRVVFYLSLANKNLLFNHCDLLQVKPSFFVRNVVLEKLNKTTFSTQKTLPEISNYLNELLAQGVNLNQIARKLNSGDKFLIADQNFVLNSIKNLTNQIVELKKILENESRK